MSEFPAVTLDVALHPALSPLAGAHATATLATELSGLLAELGLPGEPIVTIGAAAAPIGHDAWARLSLNGAACRYDAEAVRAIRAAVLGAHDVDGELHVTQWLEGALTAQPDAALAFAASAARAAIARHAHELASPAVGAAYGLSIDEPDGPDRLRALLRHVLAHGVSVADRPAVARVIRETRDLETLDAAETLLAALRPEAIDVWLSESVLRRLTTADGDGYHGLFDFLRDGLYQELGMLVPHLRLTRIPEERRDVFGVRINHLPAMLRAGLAPDECLVNMAPDSLEPALSDAVKGWTDNPGSGALNARIGAEQRHVAEEHGLTAWTAPEYVTLALAADLRRNAHCFVDLRMTETVLTHLEEAAPGLVRHARKRIPATAITRAIRALLAEQESARNVPAVLERLLDADTAVLHDAPALGAWVRCGLAPAIATHRAFGSGTIAVYLLDRRIEDVMTVGGRLDEPVVDALLRAIRRELEQLRLSVALPCLLTAAPARARLREAVGEEFPRLTVLSYDDLPPTVNVQPLARISLDEAELEAAR